MKHPTKIWIFYQLDLKSIDENLKQMIADTFNYKCFEVNELTLLYIKTQRKSVYQTIIKITYDKVFSNLMILKTMEMGHKIVWRFTD